MRSDKDLSLHVSCSTPDYLNHQQSLFARPISQLCPFSLLSHPIVPGFLISQNDRETIRSSSLTRLASAPSNRLCDLSGTVGITWLALLPSTRSYQGGLGKVLLLLQPAKCPEQADSTALRASIPDLNHARYHPLTSVLSLLSSCRSFRSSAKPKRQPKAIKKLRLSRRHLRWRTSPYLTNML